MQNQEIIPESIGVLPQQKTGVSLSNDERLEIIAASDAHKANVTVIPKSKFGNEIQYLVENRNDSPIFFLKAKVGYK